MDDNLDKGEDDGTKATSDGGGHTETGEDSTETVTLVPSPLNVGGTRGSNTDTGDGRDERVGGRDMGRVSSTPHHPSRGTSKGTSKGEHLNTRITLEGGEGDDSVLDGVGGTRTD